MVRSSTLSSETLSGLQVSFSYAAYVDAMQRYGIKDIEAVVTRVEKGKKVSPEVIAFFRDFTIIQEADHPDFDRGMAIGSLATRLELATGQVPVEKTRETLNQLEHAQIEYDLVFG